MSIIYRISKDEKEGYWLWRTEATPRYKALKGDPYKEGPWVRIAWTLELDPILHLQHILLWKPTPSNDASNGENK